MSSPVLLSSVAGGFFFCNGHADFATVKHGAVQGADGVECRVVIRHFDKCKALGTACLLVLYNGSRYNGSKFCEF